MGAAAPAGGHAPGPHGPTCLWAPHGCILGLFGPVLGELGSSPTQPTPKNSRVGEPSASLSNRKRSKKKQFMVKKRQIRLALLLDLYLEHRFKVGLRLLGLAKLASLAPPGK
jgi:hypothetical protein